MEITVAEFCGDLAKRGYPATANMPPGNTNTQQSAVGCEMGTQHAGAAVRWL
jgi:hypothetical protein